MRTFLSALLLAGSALALPAGAPRSGQTCSVESSDVEKWTVHDFDFHASYLFTTPAHQNSWGYANFTLENPALTYRPVCSAQSSQLQDFFYGTVNYDCQIPGNGSADTASFSYSRPSGDLKINQTWNCLEEGSRFAAMGGVKLDLECTDETWENPDWQQGEFYSTRDIKCTPVTVDAPVETISAVA